MVLLAVTAETWIVTGLGFGIVLALLFCLVYILQFFGWTMQKMTAPKTPKVPKTSPEGGPHIVKAAEPTDEGTKAAIAMSLAQAGEEDLAAVAYALYLAQDKKHDIPTAMISIKKHSTDWNEKSVGLNNVGF
ncbi:MAG: OadG family protein [Paludibacteraceae bacterium]|nr:OadG family protein [Paludibacteraceae bacterium]